MLQSSDLPDSTRPRASAYTQVDTRYGRYLVNVNDRYIGYSLMLYGDYAAAEIELLKALLPVEADSGHIVVDAGANIGCHSVPLGHHIAPGGGVVFAFEPQRLVYQMLCANLAINECFNVYAIEQGLGEEQTVMHVPNVSPHSKNYNPGGIQLSEQQQDGTRVQVNRLDNLGLPNVHLIKADIEGMELPVLRGASELIKRHNPILYVELDRPSLCQQTIDYLGGIDYKCWWHVSFLYNKDNFNSVPINVFGQYSSINLLCLHESKQHLFENAKGTSNLLEVDPSDPTPSWFPKE